MYNFIIQHLHFEDSKEADSDICSRKQKKKLN